MSYTLSKSSIKKLKQGNAAALKQRRTVRFNHRQPGGSGGGGVFARGVCQEGCQTDGLISVKLLDTEGATPGDAFDVYMFTDRRTSVNLDYIATPEYGTDLSGTIVPLVRYPDGVWHLAPNTVAVWDNCDEAAS